jgi:hypothetical protein
VLADEFSFRQKVVALAALPPFERARSFLKAATIEAGASSSALLIGPDPAIVDWASLSRMQKKYNSSGWLEELANYVANSFADASIA